MPSVCNFSLACGSLSTAFSSVLARCTARRDVVFGTVLSGRLQGTVDAHPILGMFINTLPVRLSCEAQSVPQRVKDSHARLTELLRHEQAPLALAAH